VDDVVKCATCNAAITNTKPESGIIIFFCQHVYHQRCLKSATPSTTTATATPSTPSSTGPTNPASQSIGMPAPLPGIDGERVWCTICMNLQSKAKGPKGRILGQRKKV
jgi:hypothetical protein